MTIKTTGKLVEVMLQDGRRFKTGSAQAQGMVQAGHARLVKETAAAAPEYEVRKASGG